MLACSRATVIGRWRPARMLRASSEIGRLPKRTLGRTRSLCTLEKLLDPDGADEGEEGQHQGRKDGNERDDKAGSSLACAMKTLEAGSELAWDVERLVHGRVPCVANRLRERGTKRGTGEKRRAASTVPSLTLQATPRA